MLVSSCQFVTFRSFFPCRLSNNEIRSRFTVRLIQCQYVNQLIECRLSVQAVRAVRSGHLRLLEMRANDFCRRMCSVGHRGHIYRSIRETDRVDASRFKVVDRSDGKSPLSDSPS